MSITVANAPTRNGVRRRPPVKPVLRPAPAEFPGAPESAGFIGVRMEPIDSGSWPVQPVIWWQPELKLEAPHSSELRIERCHKAPAPGFIDLAPCLDQPAASHGFLPLECPPAVHRMMPQSDLTLSGWDPRAAASGRGAA